MCNRIKNTQLTQSSLSGGQQKGKKPIKMSINQLEMLVNNMEFLIYNISAIQKRINNNDNQPINNICINGQSVKDKIVHVKCKDNDYKVPDDNYNQNINIKLIKMVFKQLDKIELNDQNVNNLSNIEDNPPAGVNNNEPED